MASTLLWTILRPGGLTDQPGTGRVQLGTHVPFGDIPRADVAATAVATLASPASVGHAWGLVSRPNAGFCVLLITRLSKGASYSRQPP